MTAPVAPVGLLAGSTTDPTAADSTTARRSEAPAASAALTEGPSWTARSEVVEGRGAGGEDAADLPCEAEEAGSVDLEGLVMTSKKKRWKWEERKILTLTFRFPDGWRDGPPGPFGGGPPDGGNFDGPPM